MIENNKKKVSQKTKDNADKTEKSIARIENSEIDESTEVISGIPSQVLKEERKEINQLFIENKRKQKKYFGRYEIIKEIGRGGMGKVYKAYDPQLARFVALKFLNFEDGLSKEHKERFLREAQITAKLRHPNIVVAYDMGEEDGQPFFTMGYIEGSSLKI